MIFVINAPINQTPDWIKLQTLVSVDKDGLKLIMYVFEEEAK